MSDPIYAVAEQLPLAVVSRTVESATPFVLERLTVISEPEIDFI
jgi:hypothetical protein